MRSLPIRLFLTAGISLLTLFTLSAQNWWKSGIKGEGPTVTRTLELDRFDGFGLNFSGTVYLRQGSPQSVEVEAQQNIIDNIETSVRDGYWRIEYDRPVRRDNGVTIWITIPTLTKTHISGSGTVKSESLFSGLDAVDLSISGSGNLNMNLEANTLESHISGSGDMQLHGSTRTHDIRISGSGDVDALDLQSRDVDIRISGSGDCEVHADEYLVVSTSGSGDVFYKGRPRVKAKVSGSGDVEPKE